VVKGGGTILGILKYLLVQYWFCFDENYNSVKCFILGTAESVVDTYFKRDNACVARSRPSDPYQETDNNILWPRKRLGTAGGSVFIDVCEDNTVHHGMLPGQQYPGIDARSGMLASKLQPK
jgi:hypothetical protein